MKAVVQRVQQASIVVDGVAGDNMGQGLVVLLGVGEGDTPVQAEYLADKIINLRIFTDSQDKMNLSLGDVDGEILIVSNFTLYGNCKKGNRPSFTASAPPVQAEALYLHFVERIQSHQKDKKIHTGSFGADMQVSLINDGPVTILMDTEEIMPKK